MFASTAGHLDTGREESENGDYLMRYNYTTTSSTTTRKNAPVHHQHPSADAEKAPLSLAVAF